MRKFSAGVYEKDYFLKIMRNFVQGL